LPACPVSVNCCGNVSACGTFTVSGPGSYRSICGHGAVSVQYENPTSARRPTMMIVPKSECRTVRCRSIGYVYRISITHPELVGVQVAIPSDVTVLAGGVCAGSGDCVSPFTRTITDARFSRVPASHISVNVLFLVSGRVITIPEVPSPVSRPSGP